MPESLETGVMTGRRHGLLPGVDLVHVAAKGVDLPVVGHVAEGLGQGPGWERVGAVALVDHRQGALELLPLKVREKLLQLGGHEHPLVHDRAG
jgi:hypothetical protein